MTVVGNLTQMKQHVLRDVVSIVVMLSKACCPRSHTRPKARYELLQRDTVSLGCVVKQRGKTVVAVAGRHVALDGHAAR